MTKGDLEEFGLRGQGKAIMSGRGAVEVSSLVYSVKQGWVGGARAQLLPYSFNNFYSVECSHSHSKVDLLSSIKPLQNTLTDTLEVCLLGDFKSHQADNRLIIRVGKLEVGLVTTEQPCMKGGRP